MRANVQFEVVGATLFDLYGEAAKKYRQLVGVEDAQLPHSTHMDVQPQIESSSGEVMGWIGTISVLISDVDYS